MDKHTRLRSLPAVNKILQHSDCQTLRNIYPAAHVSRAVAEEIDVLRQAWKKAEQPSEGWWQKHSEPHEIVKRVEKRLKKQFRPSLRPVLNLTGVVIHTNLGRAPLSKRAVEAVCAVAEAYSNLEYDLNEGIRGSRHSHVEERLCRLTGAEAALVVNNNAAAVLLVLQEMARGGEAIVSRGQLVEIGGSFRIPDIMAQSGVRLVEVGTTNKTKLKDYEQAITEHTKLIVRVHTSNFRIIGFTEQPELSDLVLLAHQYQVPVYEDLGSGALFDYSKWGVGDEPTIGYSLNAGVDVVSFSGDKLLGGAQAGIIAGRKTWIDRMRKNPLLRALRPDKMTIAALEATLLAHEDLDNTPMELPVVRMLTESEETVRQCAEMLLKGIQQFPEQYLPLRFSIRRDLARVGGGALPTEELPSSVLSVEADGVTSQSLFDMLRTIPDVPIIGRITNELVVLDVRTLLPHQYEVFLAGLRQVAGLLQQSS